MAQPQRSQTPQSRSLEQSTPEIREHYAEMANRLLARRDEILGRIDEARANLDEQVMTAPGDAADESVVDASADYFLSIANSHQLELVEIREALDRMHRGVYGTCENCENPIMLERLRNLPYARFCIDCQSAAERRNPLRTVPPKL